MPNLSNEELLMFKDFLNKSSGKQVKESDCKNGLYILKSQFSGSLHIHLVILHILVSAFEGGQREILVDLTSIFSCNLVTAQAKDWRLPLIEYFKGHKLPEDKNERRRLQTHIPRFCQIRDVFYKKYYDGPLMKCISEHEGQFIIEEIHQGVCGIHHGGRSLA